MHRRTQLMDKMIIRDRDLIDSIYNIG